MKIKLTRTAKIYLAVAAAVIYVAMFVVAAYCAFKVENCLTCKKCECSIQQSNPRPKKMKTIDKCLEILAPAPETMGTCEWLAHKENTAVGPIENYSVEETLEIPADTLRMILDKKYYIENSDIRNSGIYSPMARVSYTAKNGKYVSIVYSFANAQVSLYRNNEMVKDAMLYDPNELKELLDSLQK